MPRKTPASTQQPEVNTSPSKTIWAYVYEDGEITILEDAEDVPFHPHDNCLGFTTYEITLNFPQHITKKVTFNVE